MSTNNKSVESLYTVECIEKLISEFKKFPGVGPRLAERITDYILQQGNNYIETLCNTLKEVAKKVKQCKLCFSYCEGEICPVCTNPKKRTDSLCIVLSPKDVLKIESLGEFSGRYFVLGNINIKEIEDNLRIKILKERLKNSGVKEIVFAVGADYNGTYIINYLVEKVLSQYNISVYEVSIGVPLGYPLEFVDTNTLRWAFKYKRLVR